MSGRVLRTDTAAGDLRKPIEDNNILETGSEDEVAAEIEVKNQRSAENGQGRESIKGFASSPIISIRVGKDRFSFTAHEEILTEKSPFFAACLKADMRESQERSVDFPEDNCDSFVLFFKWIYKHQVPEIADEDQDSVNSTMQAWVLADRFCMPVWQNRLIDELVSFWKRYYVHPEHLVWVLENVHQGCPLFKLTWAQFVYDLNDNRQAHYPYRKHGSHHVAFRSLLSDWPSLQVDQAQLFLDLVELANCEEKVIEPVKKGEDHHVCEERRP